MPDFLTNLSQRVLGTGPLVRPNFPSLFAPQRAAGEGRFAGSEPGSDIAAVGEPFVSPDNGGNDPSESAGSRWDGDGDDPRSSFPVNRSSRSPERPVGGADAAPPPVGASSRPALLPPISPPAQEGPPQPFADDPFSSERSSFESESESGREERRTVAGTPAAGVGENSFGKERERGKERSEERSGQTAGEPSGENAARKGTLRTDEDRQRPRGMADRLIARTVERTIEKNPFGGKERQTSKAFPRRHAAASEGPRELRGEQEEERRGRAERFEEEFVSPAPESSFPFVRTERSIVPEGEDVAARRGEEGSARRAPKAAAEGRTLLVPDHIARGEREEASEGTISSSSERSGGDGGTSRTINVTIGRIEVRGTPERKTPPVSARQPAKKASEPAQVMSLDDYLKRYNGRKG